MEQLSSAPGKLRMGEVSEFQRIASIKLPDITDEAGKRRCVWCGAGLSGAKKRWCSDECVDEYLTLKDPQRIRTKVLDRDKGICAKCGRDNVTEQAAFRVFVQDLARTKLNQNWHSSMWATMQPEVIAYLAKRHVPHSRAFGDWWDADHITPVVEGGGGACGLENFRTLCYAPCHVEETAKLAKRRAEARRLSSPLSTDDVA